MTGQFVQGPAAIGRHKNVIFQAHPGKPFDIHTWLDCHYHVLSKHGMIRLIETDRFVNFHSDGMAEAMAKLFLVPPLHNMLAGYLINGRCLAAWLDRLDRQGMSLFDQMIDIP